MRITKTLNDSPQRIRCRRWGVVGLLYPGRREPHYAVGRR